MFTKADIEKYFMAEKQESLIFLVIGIVAIVSAIVFMLIWKTSFFKGMAVPLIAVGILQAVVGWTVYKRSDSQRIDNVYSYDMDPAKLRNQEVPRMEVVMKNFVLYRYAEIALLIAGVILVFVFRTNPEKTFWCGLGMALAIQSLLMLIADFFAEKRGHEYFDGLKSFLKM
jgi:uncharacterized membrane protein HdeD (DUF308 family)